MENMEINIEKIDNGWIVMASQGGDSSTVYFLTIKEVCEYLQNLEKS